MKNLFLTILLLVFLFLVFRRFRKYNINTFYAVVFNYFVCLATGYFMLSKFPERHQLPHSDEWVHLGIITGALFVPTFYLMGLTVEKVSVSVATVANKMSLVIPVIFSILFLQKAPHHITFPKLAGIVFSIASIILTSVKNENITALSMGKFAAFALPFSIFILGGATDTLINYANYTYLQGEAQAVYPMILFCTAAVAGSAATLFRIIVTGEFPRFKDFIGGVILGVPNYFSIYFMLKTLSDFNNDGAVVYPVINIGVIIAGSLAAVLLFREKLTAINLVGICLSAVSLILVFW